MFKIRANTIRKRLLIAFVFIGVVPVILAAAGSVTAEVYNGQRQARERLQSVALSKATAIESWVNTVFQELALVSFSESSFERISVVLSLARDNVYLDFYNTAVRNRFMGFISQSQFLTELYLVDLEGKVVLSTDITQEGKEVSASDYFQEGLERQLISLPYLSSSGDYLVKGQPVALFSIPIAGLDGQTAGMLVGKVSISELQTILQDQTGLGDTGKAYILSENGIPLSSNTSAIPVAGTEIAYEGELSGIGSYKNNQENTIIGVFRWLPDQRGVLFVEQNQNEAAGTIITTLEINLVIAMGALIVAIIFSLIIRSGISRPLEKLANTATRIAAGDLQSIAEIESEDEIGMLARAFNSMTQQLRFLINDLEERVELRTRDLKHRALQLETNAQVSRDITSILDITQLIGRVTELIREAFGYYGVHIYIIENETGQLIYWGKKEDRKPAILSVDTGRGSLIGEVAHRNEALLINDVTQDHRYMEDENYPEVRSELVIPLRFGESTIGILDLLSTERNAFTAEDLLVAQSLGDQIAVAINNARLYEQSRSLAVLQERNRMARQLHDSMNQSLYSAILLSGAGHNDLEKGNYQSAKHYFKRIERLAQQALKEMRLMVFELRPKVLEQKGILGALKQRLETVEQGAGIDFHLITEGEFKLDPDKEEKLYRIAQEALNNTLKHADAKNVTVSLICNKGKLIMTIEDDGVGFDPEHLSHRGIGLASIEERAEALSASLRIKSSPGEGTKVQVEMDLDQNEVML